MKSLSFCVLFTLFSTIASFSQNEKSAASRAQNVYGEFGGNGIFFSGNYDCRIFKSQKGLGIRLGLGFFGGSGAGIVTVPIGINYLKGSAPNFLEAGLGYTYASFTGRDNFLEGDGSLLVPNVGYRYQPVKMGFTGRVFISPLIAIGPGAGWIFYGGVSGGYKF
jgi:hypothetical protein